METLTQEQAIITWRDSNFYNFTLVEHGIYDAADQIDYILNVTGAKSLALFGHSQVCKKKRKQKKRKTLNYLSFLTLFIHFVCYLCEIGRSVRLCPSIEDARI